MTPYAYTLGRDRPLLFPTLDAVARYLDRWDNDLRAHIAGVKEPQEVDLSLYVERVTVDEAALRVELMVRVADDRARFEKVYPHGRPPGARCSGDHWLCEYSIEELAGILARQIERRSWKWKELT